MSEGAENKEGAEPITIRVRDQVSTCPLVRWRTRQISMIDNARASFARQKVDHAMDVSKFGLLSSTRHDLVSVLGCDCHK